MTFEIVNPASLGAPRGWNNGMLAPRDGRLLFIAGQVGLEPGAEEPPAVAPPMAPPGAPTFAAQFATALDRVLAVVRDAGGGPADIGRMTVYVTDLAAWRAARVALGEGWKARFGTHYPAMALVEVKALVEDDAKVEIEATAVL